MTLPPDFSGLHVQEEKSRAWSLVEALDREFNDGALAEAAKVIGCPRE